MNRYSDDNYQHTQIKSGEIGYHRLSGRVDECPKCKLGDMYRVVESNIMKCSECGFEQLKTS